MLINMIKELKLSRISSKSAEVSFYLLLSIFPFLMFSISVVAYMPIIQINRYINILKFIMPNEAFSMVVSIINSAIDNKNLSIVFISFILTMWTSSRAVSALIRGMNDIYEVKETRSPIKVFIISIVFTIMLLFLMLMSMILLIWGEKIAYLVFSIVNLDYIFLKIFNVLRYLIGIVTVIIILMSLYIYTPNKKNIIKDVLIGSTISTLSWIVCSFLYSYYTSNYTTYHIIYGSIGGIIVLITWIYFSSFFILLGCQINNNILMYKEIKKM